MATGQDQSGGLFARPDVTSIGLETWAEMTGVHPDSPLVGGRGVPTGGIDADYRYRRVALASATSAPSAAPGSEVAHGDWRELFNLKHNPMGWLLIAAIAYLGIIHIHLQGSAGAGFGKAKAGAGAKVGT